MGAANPHAFLEVWLYHDETKDADLKEGKRHAHIILVVPERLTLESPHGMQTLFEADPEVTTPRSEFLFRIQEIRTDTQYSGELHASSMSGKQWGKRECCGARVLDLASEFLRHKGPKGELPAPFFRFGALFFPPKTPSLRTFYSGDDPEKKIQYFETLMRMAIKGVLHYGYSDLEQVYPKIEVTILGLILDGDEHLKRPIDQDRVIERLRGELRPGLAISPDFEIRAVDSDPKTHTPGTRDYDDCELLQVADLLLGAVRFVADGSYHGLCPPETAAPKLFAKLGSRAEKMAWVYLSICELLKKKAARLRKSPKAWKHSGHYRSFTISRAELDGEKWQFWEVEWEYDEGSGHLLPLFPDLSY
ncbi:hypothetical protein Ocepr_1970 [Oceanithermus profundus DSM 14977]|uniref:Uncharacterized protein n=2 Tax=Oceanithermus profundus TaxID=187137 RepID=E4UA45_OCEP5|nr:hypothetical protein Ocepr_1970 [Oceanithermus profundus DSM 14977]